MNKVITLLTFVVTTSDAQSLAGSIYNNVLLSDKKKQ